MKSLLLTILIFLTASTCPPKKAEIPQKLKDLNFTQHTLIVYSKVDNKEFYTFSDWTTKEKGDTITFLIIDGKIKDRFKREVKEDVRI